MPQDRFQPTRRDIIKAGGITTVTTLAGCVEGEIVDVTYDCTVDEPQNIPEPTRPLIGDKNAPVEITVCQAYSSPPTGIFMLDVIKPVIENHVTSGEAYITFYDYPLSQNTTWGLQLASVGRYIHAKYGNKTYQEYLFKLHKAQVYDRSNLWQSVGDIAKKVGADPCTTISHGSWKTYKEASLDDKQWAKSNGVEEAPVVFVDGERIREMSPVTEALDPLVESINMKEQQ